MATFDAQNSNHANAGTSVSCNITVGSLTNGIMFIACHNDREGGDNINTPTVDGSTSGVTLVDSQSHSFGTDWWQKVFRVLAPTSGTKTVAFTVGAASNLAIGVITYSGVDQTTPTRTAGKAVGSGTGPTVNATTVSGDTVAEFFWWRSNNSNRLLTFDVSQTSRMNRPNGETGVGISEETASGATTTASGTIDASDNWMVMAVPMINAAGGGGGGGSRPMFRGS